jgi:hypothetical protein
VNPLFLQVGGKLALVAVLAGIVVRNRFSQCRAFTVYLLVVLLTGTAVSLFPERLFRWDVWIFQQFLFNVCKLATAVELFRRAFALFPGARSAARVGWTIVVVLTTISIAAATPDRMSNAREAYQSFVFAIQPRIVNATIWLFVITARLVSFFNLPWTDWHRAISLGFCVYLVIFVTGLNLQRKLGFSILDVVNRIDGTAYLLLTLWWAWAAWRKEPPADPGPPSLQALAVERA